MNYRLEDLVDIEQFQMLQDRLSEVYSFPSAIIDNDGNVLTATAWQDICTEFHRQHHECRAECIKSDQYILDHLHEANPAVSYRCPHGLIDNATPIIVDGRHLGSFFTGQFLLEPPDLDFFRAQAQRYGFDTDRYLAAAKRVPVWSEAQLASYLSFIKGLIEVISSISLKNLRALEASAKVAESESQFRATFENASLGMTQADPVTGQWLRVNQRMCEITGYSADELLAMRVPDITHPDDRQADREAFERIIRSGAPDYRLEKRYIRKDGAVVWVNVNIAVMRDAAGQPTRTMATIEDITDRRRAAEERAARADLHRSILQTAMSGFWLTDTDGRLLQVNDAYCRMSGYSERELLALRIVDLEAAESAVETAAHVQRLMAAGEDRFETRHRRRDGTVFDVEVSMQYRPVDGGRCVVFLRDITERKQAEQVLRTHQATQDKMLANIGDVIVIIDQDSINRYKSPNIERWFGWKPEEVVGANAWENVHPDDVAAGQAFIASLMAAPGLTGTTEVRYRCKDGGYRWIEFTGTNLMDDPDIRGILGNYHDISERKRAEEALLASEERLVLAQDAAKLGTWDWDVAGGQIVWSPQMYALLGMDPSRSVASFEVWRQALHPEDTELAYQRIEQALRDRSRLDSDYRVIWPDGQVRWLNALGQGYYDDRGQPTRMVGFCRDVTDAKQAAEALRSSEEQFRGIFTEAATGMALVSLEGRFLQVNPSFCRFVGYSEAELLGRLVADVTAPDDRTTSALVIKRASGEAEGVKRHEKRYVTKSGHVVWGEVSVTPLRNAQGDVTCLVAHVNDISERKQADVERDQLTTQLAQAQKMESVGRLAGGVAHDFNNMLAVILGHIELAMDEVDPTLSLHEDLASIQEAALRSAELTKQLLAFARKQTVEPRVLDLNDTVTGMLRMIRRLIGEGIDLDWRPATGLWSVKMDPSQMDQILTNLCINARDAMEGVGQIAVEARNCALDDNLLVAHPGSVAGEYVRLVLSDTGRGMDQATLEHVFEPFFTTKEQGRGTGLGLAMVYGIVKQNGGFIEVASEPGKGARFTIYLPRYRGEALPLPVTAAAARDAGGQTTILLVEDEPGVLRMAVRQLQRQGYTVLSAGTPAHAMRLANEHDGQIDLLLTDVIMPDMNGRDLAAALLERHPGLKCLYMSGHTADVITSQGALDDDVHFLAKPFSGWALAAKVAETLRGD